MHPNLDNFLRHYTGVVLFSLLPVILTAFLSMPFSLGHHPGEAAQQQTTMSRHMT